MGAGGAARGVMGGDARARGVRRVVRPKAAFVWVLAGGCAAGAVRVPLDEAAIIEAPQQHALVHRAGGGVALQAHHVQRLRWRRLVREVGASSGVAGSYPSGEKRSNKEKRKTSCRSKEGERKLLEKLLAPFWVHT